MPSSEKQYSRSQYHFKKVNPMRNLQIDEVESYVTNLFVQESEAQKNIRERMKQIGKAGIAVSPIEGKLLFVLTKLVGARRVLEIGTLYGYSGVCFANAVSPSGRVVTIEKNASYFAEAAKSFADCGVSEKVHQHLGDAREVLLSLDQSELFDIAFIDANKSAYFDYLKAVIPRVRKGGLIIGDNTLLFGEVLKASPEGVSQAQWNAMREFNRELADPSRYCSLLVPTAEGMTVAMKLY